VHSAEKAVEGPFVSYNQNSDKPVFFTVLLCPTTNDAPAPVLPSLAIEPGSEGVTIDNATGVQICQEGNQEFVALADAAGLRNYGGLITDGEAAYVRIEAAKVVEAGLVGGQNLVYAGQTLVEAAPEISSISLRYAGNRIHVDVRGRGKFTVAAGSTREIELNGTAQPHGRGGSLVNGRWEFSASNPGSLDLDPPVLTTDPNAVYKAYVGFRPHPTAVPPWNPVLVTWKTSLPSDAIIEYAPLNSEHWLRNMKPDAVYEHRMVLSRLTPGTTYRIRVHSSTHDGRSGTAELTYQSPLSKLE
jgi:hypothetical protein